MNTFLKTLLLSAALTFGATFTGTAQTTSTDGAYWVVETNVKKNSYSIIRIYNKHDELVYQERIEGKSLDIKKRRHKKLLDQTLKIFTEQQILASRLGKSVRL
ncbi:hypothetical protein D770_19005 [Flammeovirgaceae bacterium 311]|nr:hypothetical protein D770_19005 [Flammeovirgaceae bacterium 311]